MKWTDHSKLEAAYMIRVIGWPSSVPLQNPSSLSVAQNKQVLEDLRNGSMRFERTAQTSRSHTGTSSSREASGAAVDESMDISWAYRDPDEPPEPVSAHLLLNTLPMQDWGRRSRMNGNVYTSICQPLQGSFATGGGLGADIEMPVEVHTHAASSSVPSDARQDSEPPQKRPRLD